MTIRNTPFLRRVLVLDTAMSGVAALAFIAGAGLIASLTMLPQALVFWAGVVLVLWTAFLGWVASRAEIAGLVLKDIVGINVLWAAASFGLLVGGLVQPNALGIALVIVQAVAVAALALFQSMALRGGSPARSA